MERAASERNPLEVGTPQHVRRGLVAARRGLARKAPANDIVINSEQTIAGAAARTRDPNTSAMGTPS